MTSLELSEKLKMSHFSVYRIVMLHKKYFEELGPVKIKKLLPGKDTKGGRPIMFIKFLNQLQINFLVSLLKNTPETVKLKFKIIKTML